MALISLRIPDEVAARLSAVAASEGGKSALLRRLIADVLNASPARIAPLPVGRPEKITVRFRESEMRQLADTARQRGMTRTGWIVALVRSRLGSPVQHSLEELAALRAIVRELNRIGQLVVDRLATQGSRHAVVLVDGAEHAEEVPASALTIEEILSR